MGTVDRVADHLRSLQYAPAVVDDTRLDLIAFGPCMTIGVNVYCLQDVLRVQTQLAVIPEKRLLDALQLANMLNAQDLYCGCFYITPQTRYLMFEAATPLWDEPTREQVAATMQSLWQVGWFFPLFARVMWANLDATTAYQNVANPEDGPDALSPTFDLVV